MSTHPPAAMGLLHRLGADLDARAEDGRYPLDATARPKTLAALLDAGTRAHSNQVAAQLRRLTDAGDLATLARLLALGVHLHSNHNTGAVAICAAPPAEPKPTRTAPNCTPYALLYALSLVFCSCFDSY